jgi:Flp pilus assembly protein TadG
VIVMLTVCKNVRRALAAFPRARKGNVAITFALAVLPIVGAVGFAVDYSHANSVKAAMQSALDSTALILAKEASTDTNSQLQANALKYFQALFTRPEAKSVTISASYTSSGGSQVVVNGSASVPTNFLGIIGYQNITVNGTSTTKWGTSRLRVALVLDNTGSMADDGKIDALKTATKSLLSQLQGAVTTNGDVYVSIIPFSKDVNVGTGQYNGTWIDWDDWEAANGSWQNTSSCSSHSSRGRSYCTSTQTWVPANHNSWNGCITDRDQNYDQNVTAPNPADANLPSASASTLYPAEQYSNCPLAMMGLSYNWTSMSSLVDQMYPNGSTNQPVGLVWGWLSLTGGGPLSAPTMTSGYNYQQAIILLSDGLNTQDRWYGNGSATSTQVDARMYNSSGQGTCANIKAAGITIYTIQVNTGGDPTSTLLQNCASSSDKFWMLTSASQIVTVFNQIGTNLTKLRVAK